MCVCVSKKEEKKRLSLICILRNIKRLKKKNTFR